MHPIDFSHLLHRRAWMDAMPSGVQSSEGAYEEGEGIRLRHPLRPEKWLQEVVRLGEDALLLASDCVLRDERKHVQTVSGSDWIHIQFRLRGGGQERINGAAYVPTPDDTCMLACYPRNAVIERVFDDSLLQAVCLLLTPQALLQLLGARVEQLPPSAQWLTHAHSSEPATRMVRLPMQPAVALCVNEVLNCSFSGRARLFYMRGKALELTATLLDALENEAACRTGSIKLTESDTRRISAARLIMIEELESTMTLAQLARRVGLNRTKLALGFKQLYGDSVQAYWRDARLSRARALLQERGARVTDVAMRMGYSELSSFTRAFIRRFGVLPRHCKEPAS